MRQNVEELFKTSIFSRRPRDVRQVDPLFSYFVRLGRLSINDEHLNNDLAHFFK